MKGIWKIRILVVCVLGVAIYMGYGLWNDYFEAQEVLVGATWEIPLSKDYNSWEHELQEKEKALNSVGLSLERVKKPKTEEDGGEWLGVRNQEGKVIVPTIYDYIAVDLEEGYLFGETYEDQSIIYTRLMDPTGISEFLGPEGQNGHYYNYDGTDFIKIPKGCTVRGVAGEYVLVERDNHRILLDKEGQTILDLKDINIDSIFDEERGIFKFSKYDEVYQFSEKGTGLIDSSGKVLLEAEYGWISKVSDNRFSAIYARSTDPEAGEFFLDGDFKPISGKQYETVTAFEHGIAAVQDATGWHIINEDEEILADIPKALEVMSFSEGMAVAWYKDECKYIDRTGKVLFSKPLPRGTEEQIYTERNYSEGRIVFVGKNKKLGFMDPQGRVIVEPIFTDASASKDGTAFVSIGAKSGVIRF